MGSDAKRTPQETTQYRERLEDDMFSRGPASTAMPTAPPSDPNELLRRIDQQTTQMFHWVRAGMVVVIILLLLIAVGF
jgi:hypothetical protein